LIGFWGPESWSIMASTTKSLKIKSAKTGAELSKFSSDRNSLLPDEFDFSGTLEIRILFSKGKIQKVNCAVVKPGDVAANGAKKNLKAAENALYDENVEGENPSTIFIKENKTLQRLSLSDVLFVKAMGDYVCIYTPERKITIHHNLKSLEMKLPKSKFLRIHRSYMVAIDKIEMIEESTLYIGSHPVPVGESYRSKLMKFLSIIK
jgi:hypothetical protein